MELEEYKKVCEAAAKEAVDMTQKVFEVIECPHVQQFLNVTRRLVSAESDQVADAPALQPFAAIAPIIAKFADDTHRAAQKYGFTKRATPFTATEKSEAAGAFADTVMPLMTAARQIISWCEMSEGERMILTTLVRGRLVVT